jgi:transcriptional regulator GlxA family with amidase domain
MHEYCIPTVPELPTLRASERRRRIVVVASPTPDPLELIGPINVLNVANFILDHSGRSDLGYDLEVVTTRSGVIHEIDGLKIIADKPYQRLRGRVDTLLFQPMELDDLWNREDHFLAWVKRMSAQVRRIGSICFGTYILAEAGVLEGRHVATHWAYLDDFKHRYPGVILDIAPIYLKDDHIYTSAGATSGLDLSLALIEEDFGRDVALRVAQTLVLYLKRPGSQAQFSVQIPTWLTKEARIAELQSYIFENPSGDLRVEALSERAGMSPRNFSRVFAREVGMAPGNFVEQSRLDVARQRLEKSEASISQIAEWCGYSTTDGMRLSFERRLGVSPREYRRRFSSSRAS